LHLRRSFGIIYASKSARLDGRPCAAVSYNASFVFSVTIGRKGCVSNEVRNFKGKH